MKLIQLFLLCFFSMHMLVTTVQGSIFYAVQEKNTRSLKNLLKQNQESMQCNEDGQTILHVAVLSSNRRAVKVILKSGFTNINQLDKYGKTAMDYAVEYGYNNIVRKLYKYNGKVTSVVNATFAKKIITRPFKILFGIGMVFFMVSIFFIIKAITIAIAPCGLPRGCQCYGLLVADGIEFGINILVGIGFGIPAVSLLVPAVHQWKIRSRYDFSIIEPIS